MFVDCDYQGVTVRQAAIADIELLGAYSLLMRSAALLDCVINHAFPAT